MGMTMKQFDVYGIGNALVDIQIPVEPRFLAEESLAKGVMTLVTPETQARLLSLLDQREMKISSGGSACNTVVGVANFGGLAFYAGKVGDDMYGRFFQDELKEIGVLSTLPPGDGPTGTCLVMITPDADRTLQTCLATSIDLDEADIDGELIAASKYVYVEGYLWDAPGPRRASLKAIELARKAGVPVAYSYSDPFCVRRAAKDFRELSNTSLDLVFCNEEEARMISERADRMEAISEIAAWGPSVYMTVGADGAYLAHEGKVSHIKGVKVEAVDTNGAGDLFAGGVLYGLTHGKSPLEAGKLGNYAAAQVVTQIGPRLEKSLAGEVDRILALDPDQASAPAS